MRRTCSTSAVRRSTVWPGFAADLGVDLFTSGTIVAAVDAADAAQLDTLAEFLAHRGRDVDRLTGRELRRVEPTIAPGCPKWTSGAR